MLATGCLAFAVDPGSAATSTGVPASVLAATSFVADSTAVVPTGAAAEVVVRYQARIPQLMAEQDIPGLAVAVVDRDQVLWSQGFGATDTNDGTPIGVDTTFGVQSMSKLFTATAVMQAVQRRLVALDEPITTYLPSFTVHSAFEPHPERKITLRMLLSHTAGFTHEAPVGNNDDPSSPSFDAHVASISDTWLRFPVGTGYAYSNLGIDLAGYILEKVEGRPFPILMQETLLGPLGMTRSTFDAAAIRATADRAIGHSGGLVSTVVVEPMTAAGGLYSSVSDLARFLSFQIQGGSLDGGSVLDPALVEEMRTVPAPRAGAAAGYALGVARTRWRAEAYQDLFNHGGGGFGFLSDLWWSPSIGIGIAVLTNSVDHNLQSDLALSIMRDLVDQPGTSFHDRLGGLTPQSGFDEQDIAALPPDLGERITAVGLPATPDAAARWAPFAGSYRVSSVGIIDPTLPADRFVVEAGVPYFEATDDGPLVRHRLTEVRPNLFLAENGEVLDLTGPAPTWRNIRLVPATGGPLPWQAGILTLIALVAGGWLVTAVVGTVRGRRRDGGDRRQRGRWSRPVTALASLTAIVALTTIGLIAAIPGLVDSGFLGYIGLPTPERLALHLPLALSVLAVAMAIVTLVAWGRRAWPIGARLRFTGLAVASLALTGALASWRLIGFGFA